jgi:predicted ABC-type ATPase
LPGVCERRPDRRRTRALCAIPEATIRRRFAAGRENFERLYAPLVDAWALYDNAGATPVLLDWSEKP